MSRADFRKEHTFSKSNIPYSAHRFSCFFPVADDAALAAVKNTVICFLHQPAAEAAGYIGFVPAAFDAVIRFAVIAHVAGEAFAEIPDIKMIFFYKIIHGCKRGFTFKVFD